MREKTRILVTNALYVLPLVDEVILLKNGTIVATGSCQRLSKENEAFKELMENYHPSHAHEHHHHVGDLSSFKVIPQGFVAGFLDAIGGGGWGPVNTPLLLSSKKIQPRYAIGTVSASEFFVTSSAALSFIIFLGITQINWFAVIALSLGGMVAAPISAYLVKVLPINILAICVGGLIIFTNSNALLSYFVKDSTISNTVRFIIILAIIILLVFQVVRNKKLSFSYKKSRVNKYN